MFAPLTVNVVAMPLQIVGELILNAGRGFTSTCEVVVTLHNKELVPVTEYTVVVVGEMVIAEALLPEDQL
jgi:hypothetical protein